MYARQFVYQALGCVDVIRECNPEVAHDDLKSCAIWHRQLVGLRIAFLWFIGSIGWFELTDDAECIRNAHYPPTPTTT